MIDEKMIMAALLQQTIDKFKHEVVFLVEDFYKYYDPLKSIDRSYVVKLIARLSNGIDSILNSLEELK